MASYPDGAVQVRINGMKNASLFHASEERSQHMSENARKLLALENSLADMFRGNRQEFTAGREDGEYVAVKSIENDYQWQRGRISNSLHNLTGVKYLVDLIDYGIQLRAKPAHLQTLPREFIKSLPPQAMLLQLYGILPSSLEVDYSEDRMLPVIPEQWTPVAQKLVNDTFKSCHQIFFIEKTPNPFGSSFGIKYGDLLLRLNREAQSLVNLSDLLCSNRLATKNEAEFLKRQEQLHNITLDLPEICEAQPVSETSEVQSAHHFAISSSFQAVNSINNDQKKPSLIETYISEREAKKIASSSSTSLHNLQENASARASNTSMDDSSTSEDHNVQRDKSLLSDSSASEDSKTPKNPLITMLNLLKKKPASPLGSKDNRDASASECGSMRIESTMQSSTVQMESTPKPEAPQRGRKPVSDEPKIKFIPAGTCLEQVKGSSHRGSRSRKAYSPVMENIPTSRIVTRQSALHPSDSDLSDSGTSRSNQSWNVNHTDVENHGEASSSDSSMPRNDGALPLTQKAGEVTVTVTPPPAISQSRVATGQNFANHNMSSIGMNESQDLKQFLERNVLFHGGLPPTPWMNVNDVKSKFCQDIEMILIKRQWGLDIFTLEKYMWPAILSRQNVVMVSGPKSGKTSSYLIPILDSLFDIQAPKGNGPLTLILCAGCEAAQGIFEECVKLKNVSKSKIRIELAYGLVLDEDFLIKMINGCELLVTTPCCLLRIMGRKDVYTNLRRLNHLVLDQAEILFTKFLPQMKQVQAQVVSEQLRRTLEDDPIQIVVSSEKWVPNLLHFTAHLRSNPIVCINDYLEAVVYGKASVKLHTVHHDKKPSYLIDLLQNHVKLGMMKTLIICNTEEETIHLGKFLLNACLNALILKPSDSALYMNTCIDSWNSSVAGQHYVMLCTDHEFSHRPVLDAMCLIHYSLPQDRQLFVNRLSAVMCNLRNMFDEREMHAPPVIHIFAQENNVEQLPLIVHVMQRVQEKVDNITQQLTQEAIKRKEEKKEGKPLCAHVKMFGDCWDKALCPNRHVLVPHLDSPDNLPNCGDVTMKILAVHNACHFSVRILEHTNAEGITRKWPSDYVRIAVQMSKYFSAADNKRTAPDLKIGDICAIETAENLFQRVVVLEIKESDNLKISSKVKIQFLDEGHVKEVGKYMLYSVPDVLKGIPAQATDLFVCRLLPCDNDESWSEFTNSCVRQWIKTTESGLENSKVFKGQIVFSLRGALWVDPLNIMKLLPHTQTYVSVRNIRRSLLEGQHALDNPGHLQKLYALCTAHDCFILPPIEKSILSRPRAQPKPMWAFLERDHFNAIEFIAADSMKCFYVRRNKFNSLLQKLIRDIGNALEKSRNKEIPVVEPGSICLARHSDGRWYRAQVLSVADEKVGVFYVDYGDRDDLARQKIMAIPDWAITQLPFQAIECSLAGISSCNPVDLLYTITDDGAKCLQAKVCDKITPAECTGGSHYVVAIIDCSSASPSVLNNDLLKHNGVKPVEDQFELIRLDLEECCKTFEKSEDETSDYNSDLEDDLPVSNNYNTAVPELGIRNAGCKSSDTDDTCNENEEEFVIGGCKINVNEIDWEAFEDFILESPFSEPFKNLVKGITHNRSLKALPETEAERPAILPAITQEQSCDGQEKSCNGQGKRPGEQPHHAVLPPLSSARPPQVKWYEDLYHVWIKICITGVTRFFLRWSACRIQFSTSVNGSNYHFDELLRGTICPQDLLSSTSGFIVQIKLKKACSGVLWRELFASKRKYGWVSVDHDGNKESSDDSDNEVFPTIESFNRCVKKLPIRQRRQRRRSKDGPALPEESENDSDSGGDADLIDPDLMF